MLVTYREAGRLITAECDVLRPAHVPGECDRCAAPLTGRQVRWCSRGCALEYETQHVWSLARKSAKRRDGYRCVLCGSHEGLEVDHILPRWGLGYGFGCHNHLTNLRTLCHLDHALVTRRAVRERALAAVAQPRKRRAR